MYVFTPRPNPVIRRHSRHPGHYSHPLPPSFSSLLGNPEDERYRLDYLALARRALTDYSTASTISTDPSASMTFTSVSFSNAGPDTRQ